MRLGALIEVGGLGILGEGVLMGSGYGGGCFFFFSSSAAALNSAGYCGICPRPWISL